MRSPLARLLLLCCVCALVVPAVVFASGSGVTNPVKGGVYKGTFPVSAGPNTLRVHVNKNGKKGNFTLPCAGLFNQKFNIKKGRYVVELRGHGGPEPVDRAQGSFVKNGKKTRGKVTRIGSNGAQCAPHKFGAPLVG